MLDATKTRALRAAYELEQTRNQGKERKKPNYVEAVLDLHPMKLWNHSTVAIIKADVTKLQATTRGQWRLKVGVLNSDSDAVESDDFLNLEQSWLEINAQAKEQGFVNLPESVVLGGGQKKTLELEKGAGRHDLLLLMPQNAPVGVDSRSNDTQSVISNTIFKI